ncbi:putative efflux pump antibiotic resistance protein [Hyaloscypha variabilis]
MNSSGTRHPTRYVLICVCVQNITRALSMKQEFRTPSTEIILSELHRPKNPSVSDSTTAIIVTEGDTENENIAKWKAGRQEWSIVACLLIINVVVALDGTILVPVLPIIANALHGNVADVFWTGTSYMLANAIVQPLTAQFSDVFGRRCILMLALCSFTIGLVICSIASNFTLLLVVRAVSGIGSGGCMAMTMSILTDIIPLRQRPTFQSLVALAWAAPGIPGSFIGGMFASERTWRWCFYLNFPFCLITLIMAPLVVRLTTVRPETTCLHLLKSIDWIGCLLFIGSTCSFLVGFTRGGTEKPWSSFAIWGCLMFGGLGIAAAMTWECVGAKRSFLRLQVFTSISSNAAYFCAFVQGILVYCIIYLLPFYFEACKNHSPSQAGLDLMAITASMVASSTVTSLITTYLGQYRWAVWFGCILAGLGHGLLILLDENTPAVVWAPILVILGMGHSALIMSLICCVLATVQVEDATHAAVAYSFMRSLGLCIGVAIAGTIFQNAMYHHLGDLRLPTEVAENAEAFLEFVLAYSRSFRTVFEVLVGLMGLKILASFLIQNRTLSQKLGSEYFIPRGRVERMRL